MNLSDLLQKVEEIELTDKDIDEMYERLRLANAEFEKEARAKRPDKDWYNIEYTL